MLWQLVLVLACASASAAPEIKLSRERMVFQTDHGDIHMVSGGTPRAPPTAACRSPRAH